MQAMNPAIQVIGTARNYGGAADHERVCRAQGVVDRCDGSKPEAIRRWLEAIPLASRPLNAAQTIKLIKASTSGRLRRVIEASIHEFDFIECFTTTFLRTHSWLNWVGVHP